VNPAVFGKVLEPRTAPSSRKPETGMAKIHLQLHPLSIELAGDEHNFHQLQAQG
jgi:hypothetical protein